MAAYLHCQGISVIPYLDDWLIHNPDRQVLFHHQSQLLHTLNMPGLRLNEAKSELEPVQDIQVTLGSGESFPPNIQGWGDNSTHMLNILPENFVIHRSVPIHGIIKLGHRSHTTGSSTLEASTKTFSFIRPDKPVYTTMLIIPIPAQRLDINVLEIKALILAFQHWVAVLQGHHVLIATDNNTVVAYINKQGGTHSHALLRLVVDLFCGYRLRT